jgi:hypothetical protein
MPNQSHASRFYHPHNSGWGVQIIKLLINIQRTGNRIVLRPQWPFSGVTRWVYLCLCTCTVYRN